MSLSEKLKFIVTKAVDIIKLLFNVLKKLFCRQEMDKLTPALVNVRDFVMFDLETTGFSPEYDDILEIGAYRVRDLKVVEVFQTYVNPNKPVPKVVSEITGIRRNMVKDAPTIDIALAQFNAFIGDEVLVGYNIKNFDIPFIIAKGLHKPVFNYLDVYAMAKFSPLNNTLRNLKLATLKAHYGIIEKGHNALGDCMSTLKVLEKIQAGQFSHVKAEEKYRIFEGMNFVLSDDVPKRVYHTVISDIEVRGGVVDDTVTKIVDYLIISNVNRTRIGYFDDSVMDKEHAALKLISKGNDIKIITLPQFFKLADLSKIK